MAEKISVQIALEGGKEVARQLEGIGEAGQKAFENLAKSAEQVGGFKNLKLDEVTNKLKALGLEGTAAFDKIQQAVQKASRLETLVQGIQSAENAMVALGRAAVIALPLVVAAFVAAAKATVSFSQEISKLNQEATRLGLSFEQFDRLRAGLQGVGVSAQGISSTFAKIGQAMEGAPIDNVTKAFNQLQEAAQRGFGATGTQQLQILQEAAKGAGKAAELARQKLVELGQPIPMDAPKTLQQLVSETGSAEKAIQAFITQLQNMPAGAARGKLAVQELGAETGTRLLEALRQGGAAVDNFRQKIGATTPAGLISPEDVAKANALTASIARLSAAWDRFNSTTLAPIIGSAIQGLAITIEGLNRLLGGTGTAAQQAGQQAAQGGQVASQGWLVWDSTLQRGVSTAGQVGPAAAQAGQQAAQGGSTAASGWNIFIGVLQQAINKLLEWIGLKKDQATGGAPVGGSDSGGGGGSTNPQAIPGIARGGVIGGRGTGMSDSNLAWVSRGEYIMPARAVAQPGVLAFLEALRRSGGNLRNVLDGMGRFALGGLVPRPAYAGGGAVGSMSHVTINFPGLPPIAGLRASAGVVDQLQRAAALAQVRSGGRKPSRYS